MERELPSEQTGNFSPERPTQEALDALNRRVTALEQLLAMHLIGNVTLSPEQWSEVFQAHRSLADQPLHNEESQAFDIQPEVQNPE